jgi:ubiquinone/menaquinone biosynthesis C-methylase UbiE
MEREYFYAAFGEIDSRADPGTLLEYLRRLGEVPGMHDVKRRSFELLAPAPGAVLLDVGCGTGDDARALARLVAPGGRVVGVDGSARAIAWARQGDHLEGLALEVADAHNLPYPDGEFDGCRAERTLQHLDDPERGLAEMARVTRAGGRVVVTESYFPFELDDEPLRRQTQALLDAFFSPRDRHGPLSLLLPLIFTKAGLTDVEAYRQQCRVSDFGSIRCLFQLDRLAEEARERGALRAAEAAAWLDRLEQAATAGRFAVELTAFHVAGRA